MPIAVVPAVPESWLPVRAPEPARGPADQRPVHARIEAWLERLITSGALEPGDRLPAEVEMAASLGTSRMTLRQALGSLEAKGYLVRKPGRRGGTFIARPKVEYDLSGLLGLAEQLRRTRPRPDAHVVVATTELPSSPVREALRLTARSEVHRVVRVRSAGGEPVALEESCFPAAALPGFLSEVLTRPLHALLDRRGRAPISACEVIEPVTATAERAALLDVRIGAPLLLVARTSVDRDGVAIEHSLEHHRADRMRIVVRTRLDGAPLADVVAGP